MTMSCQTLLCMINALLRAPSASSFASVKQSKRFIFVTIIAHSQPGSARLTPTLVMRLLQRLRAVLLLLVLLLLLLLFVPQLILLQHVFLLLLLRPLLRRLLLLLLLLRLVPWHKHQTNIRRQSCRRPRPEQKSFSSRRS